MVKVHTVFITHTHKRIARTLQAMHPQSHAPDTITVACDSDDARIANEVQRAADQLDREITLVLRPKADLAQRSQTRNNAVRAMLNQANPDTDHLIFYDGDCIACPQANAIHTKSLRRRHLSLGSAVSLSPEQTNQLTDEHALTGTTDNLIDDLQRSSLSKIHRKTRRHILLKPLGLTKVHKPGILSGNFGIRLKTYLAINGFDESFTGWGMEDDDLARRAYMAGARAISSMNKAVAFHQYHKSQSPERWHDSPNAHRLSESTLARCEFGLDNPSPQQLPSLTVLTPRTMELKTCVTQTENSDIRLPA